MTTPAEERDLYRGWGERQINRKRIAYAILVACRQVDQPLSLTELAIRLAQTFNRAISPESIRATALELVDRGSLGLRVRAVNARWDQARAHGLPSAILAVVRKTHRSLNVEELLRRLRAEVPARHFPEPNAAKNLLFQLINQGAIEMFVVKNRKTDRTIYALRRSRDQED
jgi:hypothetical protein